MTRRLALLALALVILPTAPFPGAPLSGHAQGQTVPQIVSLDVPALVTPLAGDHQAVTATIVVSDDNGWQDIESVTVTVYAPTGHVHREAVHVTSGPDGSGKERSYTYTFTMAFHDAPASEQAGYVIEASATDSKRRTSEAVQARFAYAELAAVSVSEPSLPFGTLLPGNTTEPYPLTITNRGNVAVDVALSGADLVHEAGSIPVNALTYGLSAAHANDTTLTTTPTTVSDFDLAPGADASRATYWVLHVPDSGSTYLPAGTYRGTIRIDAVPEPIDAPAPLCANGIDDDGDGAVDFPDDLGCSSAADDNETDPPLPTCLGTPRIMTATMHDPGFPYEDVDNDLTYTDGIDREIPLYELQNGTYHTPPDEPGTGLVIPASTPAPIPLPTHIDLAAGRDATLAIGMDLKATNHILLSGGTIMAPDVHMSVSAGNLTVDARGDVMLQGANISALSGFDLNVEGSAFIAHSDWTSEAGGVSASAGADLDVRNATYALQEDATLSSGGTLHARSLALVSSDGTAFVQGTDHVQATCARLRTNGDLVIDSSGPATVDGSNLQSDHGPIQVTSQGAASLRGATAEAAGSVRIESLGGAVNGDQVRLESTGSQAEIHGATDVRLMRGELVAGTLMVTAGDQLDVRRGDWVTSDAQASSGRLHGQHLVATSAGEGLRFDINGTASITDADLESARDLALATRGDLDMGGARLVAPTRQIEIDVGLGSASVFVDEAHIDDRNDRVRVTPSDATIVGTPASGVVTT